MKAYYAICDRISQYIVDLRRLHYPIFITELTGLEAAIFNEEKATKRTQKSYQSLNWTNTFKKK